MNARPLCTSSHHHVDNLLLLLLLSPLLPAPQQHGQQRPHRQYEQRSHVPTFKRTLKKESLLQSDAIRMYVLLVSAVLVCSASNRRGTNVSNGVDVQVQRCNNRGGRGEKIDKYLKQLMVQRWCSLLALMAVLPSLAYSVPPSVWRTWRQSQYTHTT